MAISLPQRANATTEELARDLRDLLPQLERRVLSSVTIGTTSTPLAHGLSGTPRLVNVLPHADARVWRSAAPDGSVVYLQASVSVACDVEVVL